MIRDQCTGGTAQSAEFSDTSGSGCAPHRSGILCAHCVEGYQVGADNQCSVCPSQSNSYFYFVLVAVILVFLVWVQVLVITRSNSRLIEHAVWHVHEQEKRMRAHDESSISSNSDREASQSDIKNNAQNQTAPQKSARGHNRRESAPQLNAIVHKWLGGAGTLAEFVEGHKDPQDVDPMKKYREYTVDGPPLKEPDFTYQLKVCVVKPVV